MLKISRRFRFKFQSDFFKDLEGLRRWKWVIFQKRKAIKMTSLTKDDDQNVFLRDEFVWGADGRSNAGYGFWQMAYGSDGTEQSQG